MSAALNCAGCGVCCTSPIPPALLKMLGVAVEGEADGQPQYFNDVLLFSEEIKALVERGYADAIQVYGFDENIMMFRLFSPLAMLNLKNLNPDDYPLDVSVSERWVCLSCIFQDPDTGTCVIHAHPARPKYCDIYPVRIESCPPHRIAGAYGGEKLEAIKQWEARRDRGEYFIKVGIKNFNPAALSTKNMTKLLSKITGINANKIDRIRANAYKNDPVARHIAKRFIVEKKLMEKIKKGNQVNCWTQ